MTSTAPYLRRALGITLVVITVIVCFGCADFQHGHRWEFDAASPACTDVVWKQMPRSAMPGLCSGSGYAATEATSCTIGCLVVSPYSEEQAKRIDVWGISLWEHEVEWHARRRLRHPQ